MGGLQYEHRPGFRF